MHCSRCQGGFTFVDIMIAVVVIAILAAIVMPLYSNEQERARAASMVTNLRNVGSVCKLVISEQGLLPQANGPDVPPSLEGHFSAAAWSTLWKPLDATYMGLYNANLWGTTSNYIVLQADAVHQEVCTQIDERMDDGVANSGTVLVFPVGPTVYLVYIVGTQ